MFKGSVHFMCIMACTVLCVGSVSNYQMKKHLKSTRKTNSNIMKPLSARETSHLGKIFIERQYHIQIFKHRAQLTGI